MNVNCLWTEDAVQKLEDHGVTVAEYEEAI
jgi:hypothetical protein